LNECQPEFERKTDLEKGKFRGLAYNASGVYLWSDSEKKQDDKKAYMTTRNVQRKIMGEWMLKYFKTLFSEVVYTKVISAKVEKTVTKRTVTRKIVSHKGPVEKMTFHVMINKKINDRKFSIFDQSIKASSLERVVKFYTNPKKWWTQHDKNDVVTVLMADIDENKKSIVVMTEVKDQKINDPRMFINFGKLHMNK